jgi:hypothetical protein
MSTVSSLKAKLGASTKAEVLQHPASVVPGRLIIPEDVAKEVEDAAGQQSQHDSSQKVAGVIASLNCSLDQYGQFVIQVKVGQRLEVLSLASVAGEDAIRAALKAVTGKMPPKSALETMQAEIRIATRNAARRVSTYRRVGRDGSAYLIDLGDKTGQAVRIKNGNWSVVESCACAFIRPRGYAPLPQPVRPASVHHALNVLLKFMVGLGLPQSRALLVIVALVCWLRQGVTYPVLLFYGPPGSGKSTAALFMLMLTDPPATAKLPSVSQDVEHIAAAAQMRHVVSMDNASKLSAALQDALCILATGGELLQRELYTNGETAVLPIHGGALITSVSPVATRADLLSRSVPVEFPVRESRMDVDSLIAQFNHQSGVLFGALVELVAASTVPVVVENSGGHRLHDFCIAGQRIFALAGFEPSQFMNLVDRMRATTGAEIAAGDTFVTTTREVLTKLIQAASDGIALPGYKAWFKSGAKAVKAGGQAVVGIKPTKFVELLNACSVGYGERDWLPRNARELSGALLRATPIFSDIGIKVSKREPSEGNPYWEFVTTDKGAADA